MEHKSLAVTGEISCLQEVAQCHLFRFKNYRLVRSDKPDDPMGYRLEPARNNSVPMIGFVKDAPFRVVEPLRTECSLADLAQLAGRSDVELVQWVSKWGLLGYMCRNQSDRTVSQQLNKHANVSPYHYAFAEPVELVREATEVAQAATALHAVLELPDVTDRTARLKALIKSGPVEYPLGPKTSDFWFRTDYVAGVSIGDNLEEFPNSPQEWTKRAVDGLQYLIRRYFSLNLVLDYASRVEARRPTKFRWHVHSLLGALFLKMLEEWRKTRYCEFCKSRIDHRRPQATTCSNTCRVQLSQQKRARLVRSNKPTRRT